MKTGSASSLVALAAAAFVAAPALAHPPGNESTAGALMKVEHQWLTALQRHDVAALRRILGREYIDSDFQGDAITRSRYLGYFAHPVSSSAPHVEQTFADTAVRFVAGGNVAIVTGIVITRPANARGAAASTATEVQHSRFTDVFVWRDARWQAVTGQETHFRPGTD